jgi:uncharacterized membrane protein HdeD (DUF308 family)
MPATRVLEIRALSTEPAPRVVKPVVRNTPDALRRQAVWALIAAVAMLYFGYSSKMVFVDSFGSHLLKGTLRYGGIATLVGAGILATASRWGLLVDGVVGLVVGLAMAAAAVAYSLDALSTSVIMLLVFGYLFMSSGWRQFKAFIDDGADTGETPVAETPPAP